MDVFTVQSKALIYTLNMYLFYPGRITGRASVEVGGQLTYSWLLYHVNITKLTAPPASYKK